MESRLGGSTFRPDVDRSVPKRHRTNFPLAQAPFLITFFDNWWYEDSGTDESKDFLWTRLQFEPLRDKSVTYAHEMNRQAPSGLSFVMYPTRRPGYP